MKYQSLTKVVEINGNKCVTCAYFGTPKCLIHKGESIPDCTHCDVMGAILNQLHAFEEIISEVAKSESTSARATSSLTEDDSSK